MLLFSSRGRLGTARRSEDLRRVRHHRDGRPRRLREGKRLTPVRQGLPLPQRHRAIARGACRQPIEAVVQRPDRQIGLGCRIVPGARLARRVSCAAPSGAWGSRACEGAGVSKGTAGRSRPICAASRPFRSASSRVGWRIFSSSWPLARARRFEPDGPPISLATATPGMGWGPPTWSRGNLNALELDECATELAWQAAASPARRSRRR